MLLECSDNAGQREDRTPEEARKDSNTHPVFPSYEDKSLGEFESGSGEGRWEHGER